MLLKQLEDEYQEVQRYDRKEDEHQGGYNDEGYFMKNRVYLKTTSKQEIISESQTSNENNNDRNKEYNQNPEAPALI